jgi:hypothetical protein
MIFTAGLLILLLINSNYKKMKKLNLILAAAVTTALMVCGNGAQAQKSSNTMEEGTITVNIGVGLGRSSFGGSGLYNSSYYGYGTGLGVKAAIERGMWQLGPGVLTLGLEAGGSFSSGSLSGYKSNIIIVAARSAYHFGWNVDKLDTYGGVSIGPGFRSYDYYTTSSNTKHDVVVAPGVFVGASYYFSPNIGVNVEAGYDITQVQGGLVFKLN